MSLSAPHRSIWISANAGSGKTTFLTRRLAGLLLQGVLPERICCITYTKAAASEMKHRVLTVLRNLLLMDDERRVSELTDLLGRAPVEEEIRRAQTLFCQVLDSPSGGLQLTTIHGFCQSILRRFPLEADIAPHFTVLDDAAQAKLLTRAKHRLLSKEASTDLADAFDLIGSRVTETRFDDITRALIVTRERWASLWRGQTPALLRAKLFAFHGLSENACDAEFAKELATFLSAQDEIFLRGQLPHLATHKNKTEQKTASILAQWLEAGPEARIAQFDTLSEHFCTQKNTLKKSLGKEFDGTELQALCGRFGERILRYREQTAALACAMESFAIAVIARALLDLYAQAKLVAHALDYDDLIGKTRELFANPAMLGWVMSKLDHRIDHLLIDEAQDTSGEQWQLAHALVEELIAANEGVGSGDVPRSLLVVGDEKQSIYSFQGAAPELFAAKQIDFTELLAHSYAPLAYETLAKSYRSAEVILKLVDEVARQSLVAEALSAGGMTPLHQLVRADAPGLIRLYPPIDAAEKETLPPLTMPMDYHITQTAAQRLADYVGDQLAGWFANTRLLASEGRALTPGDVLILVHRRKPLVLPLIRALERRGIPLAGLDRLTLSEHLAVRDLLALIRFVLNPADDLALAHALRSPIFDMSDETLRALCIGRPGNLASRVEHPLLEEALARRHETPYEFLTHLLEVRQARSRFAGRFGEEVHEVLDELKAQAAAMPDGLAPTLAEFHEWFSTSTQQIKREQESGKANKLRVMTVHGAKGLEAPVVLLIDTAKVPTTQHEIFYFSRAADGQRFPTLAISEEAKSAPFYIAAKQQKAEAILAEYYRLLYVALTRARDELHVFAAGEPQERAWYPVIAQAMKTLGAREEEGIFSLKDERPSRAVIPDKVQEAKLPPMPAWANHMPGEASPARLTASPSQLVPSVAISPYVQGGGAASRARGVRIHRMLEYVTAAMTKETIGDIVGLIAPDWSPADRMTTVERLFELREAHRWIWQSPATAEANICGSITIQNREIAVTGQIDRLIETPDAIVILDYKTGQHIPANPSEISENYRVQLKTYHALISQLHPNKTVRCAILWTAAPSLMWCDDAVTATAWPNQFVMEPSPLVA